MAIKYAVLHEVNGHEVFYNFAPAGESYQEHTTADKALAEGIEDKLSRNKDIAWAGIIEVVDG
ncbi:hypothetical protein [Kordiimonas sp. SCSIO 12610]|uniref:hypothetical protein n=1 Tax=Kordiimonas sp. SCSIO 12610 TaxID=2829597 RepID=UPI00210EB9B1|nr:hypothetical protein [Kordiimonas sp. SCSIO 12610]UTW55259.1 hypothetical protein KFF44_15865 [Kordiimonas sp. SCSIO 12610]